MTVLDGDLTDRSKRLRQPSAVEASPIAAKDIWKIYNAKTPADAATIIRKNMSREEAAGTFGAVVAVRNASFAVQPGEIFCIMGLSGSGKSTLIRHINRLIEPTSGMVSINGANILNKNASELRQLRAQTVGMVFQNVALMPHRSVLYNVGYGLKVQGYERGKRDKIAGEKLELVQLSGWGHRFPHELSGGMQQRVGLARALASDPPILLLDEPFSALDPLIRRQLQDEFKAISREMTKTVVFITHDLDEAMRLGDRIAIMKDGRVIQVGSPREIVMSPADNYVAEFLRGISRGQFVNAGMIMKEINGKVPTGKKNNHVVEETPLDKLLELLVENESALVMNSKGKPTGLITREILLRAAKTVIQQR